MISFYFDSSFILIVFHLLLILYYHKLTSLNTSYKISPNYSHSPSNIFSSYSHSLNNPYSNKIPLVYNVNSHNSLSNSIYVFLTFFHYHQSIYSYPILQITQPIYKMSILMILSTLHPLYKIYILSSLVIAHIKTYLIYCLYWFTNIMHLVGKIQW